MQNIRVDQSDFIRPRLVGDPEPVTDFDTGEVKINPKTGERDYRMSVAVRREGQRRASLIEVKMRAMSAPTVADGDMIRLDGLTVTFWEQGGRAGLSFRAEAVSKAVPDKAAMPAPTGSAPASGSGPVASSTPRTAGKGGEAS